MNEEAGRPAHTPAFGVPVPDAEVRETLPDSLRLTLWFSAWISGHTSLDEARDRIVGDDAAHDVIGVMGYDEPLPLILALPALRSAGTSEVGLALPEPGDALGLAGPAAFNTEALEAGEAVLLPGADSGLVPFRAGRGVVWRCLPATTRRQVPDLAEADTELRAVLPTVADALADLDVARWRPEVADDLIALRRTDSWDLPPGITGRAARMLGLASRCRRIVALALQDDGGAVTAAEIDLRRSALQPLDRAARRALVAAASAPFGR